MDKLITRKEAASILGISVKTLDAVRTDGLISYIQYVEMSGYDIVSHFILHQIHRNHGKLLRRSAL